MKPETKKRILRGFLLLSVLGFAFSAYLVKNHYALPSEGAICDVGNIASCSLVNTSVFSELLNVPVALLGARAECRGEAPGHDGAHGALRRVVWSRTFSLS